MTSTDLVAFKALLGPPILLSTENAGEYKGLFDRLMSELKPRDVMEFILIDQVFQETWKILRYQRHQTVSIERRFRNLEQQNRVRAVLQEAADKTTSKGLIEKSERPESDLSRMNSLCDIIETTPEDLGALAKQREMNQRDFMQNRALEDGLETQERLDRLVSASTKRRNELVRDLDHYRLSLGRRARQLSDQIIEAEIVELDNPRLIQTRVLGGARASKSDAAEDRATSSDR
jgi:hypothetical protein